MKNEKHPKPPFLVLKWFCRSEFYPAIEGDLIEVYALQLKKRGPFQAYLLLCKEVLLLLRKEVIKPVYSVETTANTIMLHHYLRLAIRNLRKQKSYSLVNLFGLSVALVIALLVSLYISHEFSYDNFHEDSNRIYRVTKSYFNGDKKVETVPFRSYLLEHIRDEITGVESTTTLKPFSGNQVIQHQDKTISESHITFVEDNFFDFFNFDLIQGNKKSVLSKPYTVVISSSQAQAVFPSQTAVGKEITIKEAFSGRQFVASVTGVFADMPENSHMHFDYLVSMATGEIENKKERIYSFPLKYGYLKLSPGVEIAAVAEQIPKIEEAYAPRFYATHDMHLHPQPLASIHLQSNMENELETNGDVRQVYLLVGIAGLILMIAFFNYINLTIANSSLREKEVGLRKSIGAFRKQLIGQFLTESFLNTTAALFVAIILTYFLLPNFNAFTGKTLALSGQQIETIALLAGIVLLAGLLSGFYPALILTKVKPATAMKSKGIGKGGMIPRRLLVTLQMGVAVFLMIITVVVFKQWKMLQSSKFSFNTEDIINIPVSSLTLRDNYQVLKQELLQNADVLAITGSNKNFISPLTSFNGLTVPGHEDFVNIYRAVVDADFFSLYNKKFISGRNFVDHSTDSLNSIIINQSAAKLVGVGPEEIIGMKVKWGDDDYTSEIIGVVEDFQFQSMHSRIVPMHFQTFHSQRLADHLKVITIKLDSKNFASTLAQIESTFKKLDEKALFSFSILDYEIGEAYQKELRFGQIFMGATFFSLLLAALGIFGIAASSTSLRRKEISIRKVLGASFLRVLFSVNREFVVLALAANIFAWPLAYLLSEKWLSNFAYKVDISTAVFISTLGTSLTIAILTALFWTYRSAAANPTKALNES